MEERRISIHEALPILREVLNMSGFTKLMGKSVSWFHDKEEERTPDFVATGGFSDANIVLINESLNRIADECDTHRLSFPAEGVSWKEHSLYVSKELKELRKLISFVYLREKHTSISKQSFGRKLRGDVVGNYTCQFTEADIMQINEGLKSIADMLRSFKITV